MTTLTIPAGIAGRPTRLESLLLAGADALQRRVALRMLRRADRALALDTAAAQAAATRAHVVAHLARHPFG